MASLPFFPSDMDGGIIGINQKQRFGNSAPKKKNNFTNSLSLLCENNEMNCSIISSPPKTKGYVPPYRSYTMPSIAYTEEMPMYSDGITKDAVAAENSFRGNYRGLYGNRSYYYGANTSPYPSAAASPVPSIVSSEYSTSPHEFDAPSPIPFDGGNGNSMYGNNYEGNEGFGTPFSPPSSSPYYFTPIRAGGYDSPMKSTEYKTPNSNVSAAYQQNICHSAAPQCKPVATNNPSVRDTHSPTSRTKNETDQDNGEAKIQSPSVPVTNVPLCLPVGRSYLSTAIRGNELSKSASPKTPSRPRNLTTPQTQITPPIRPPIANAIPLPQNLKGDPHRQKKVKTELCLFFSRGTHCPFGSKCNYAHGEDELKYTKLFELEKAGLVTDINAYRAYPCFSWVSTGACPFGLRCGDLHDPRAAGSCSSWLPHCDIPVSSLPTDLVVDKSHHHILAEFSQINTLVPNLLWKHRPSSKKKVPNYPDEDSTLDEIETEWRDTYSLVCNLANLNPARRIKSGVFSKVKISELQRICIAVKMNSRDEPRNTYIYKPQHLVYGELCMVLQTKYFKLLNPNNLSGSLDLANAPEVDAIAREIGQNEYEEEASFWKRDQSNTGDVIVVHELTFGCAGEPSARTSLWYGIKDMKALAPSEVKRLKRTKQRLKNSSTNNETSNKLTPYPGSERAFTSSHRDRQSTSRSRTPTSFDTHPHKPFFQMAPVADPLLALHLMKEILHHRIRVLAQREYRAYTGTDDEVRAFISAKDSELRRSYERIKSSVNNFKWPISRGRDQVSADTSVPKCGSKYTPSTSAPVTSIWNNFVSNTNAESKDERLEAAPRLSKARLPIFRQLAMSKGFNNSTKPHIKHRSRDEIDSSAWRSIFLETDDNEGWSLIKNHYLGSKVLSKDKCMPLSPTSGDRISTVVA